MTAPEACALCDCEIPAREIHICDACGRTTCHDCVRVWTRCDDGVCGECTGYVDPPASERPTP